MTYQFDFASVVPYWHDLLMGVWLTLILSAVSTVLGFIIGTVCAIGSNSGGPVYGV